VSVRGSVNTSLIKHASAQYFWRTPDEQNTHLLLNNH
jgi:hypothetical protein